MSYWFILLPFITLVIINLLAKSWREQWGDRLALGVSILQVILAVLVFLGPWHKDVLPQLEPLLGFSLVINNVVAIVLIVAGLTAVTALLVGLGTANLANLVLISLVGINGMAMVTDLFSLYVFIEVTALASFVMINLRDDILAREASFKYLIISVIASTLMLSSLALLLLAAGNFSYVAVKQAVMLQSGGWVVTLGVALFVCGLFIKGGLVPFHGWLPDAYEAAPAAVSIQLAGIVTKASGIFPLIILSAFVFGFSPQLKQVLLLVGALSIVVGALGALWQTRLKRLLAYSSISQMGYIVLALGTGTQLGFVAALFHFFNHALFKSQLFANAAVIPDRPLSELGGLSRQQPVTAVTAVIASLSTSGLPPFAGFWSKLLVVMALWLSGHYFYAFLAVVASVLTLAYFLLVLRQVFFRPAPAELPAAAEGDWPKLLPVIVLCAITVIFGVCFPFVVNRIFVS